MARSCFSGGNISYPKLKTRHEKNRPIDNIRDDGATRGLIKKNTYHNNTHIESCSDMSLGSPSNSLTRNGGGGGGGISIRSGHQLYSLSDPKYITPKAPVGLIQRKTSIDIVIKNAAKSPGVGDYDYGRSYQSNVASGSSRYRPKTTTSSHSSNVSISTNSVFSTNTSSSRISTPSSISNRWASIENQLKESSLTPGPGSYHNRLSRQGFEEGGRPSSVHMENRTGIKSEIEQVIERESKLPGPLDYQSHEFYYDHLMKASSINYSPAITQSSNDPHTSPKKRRNKQGLLIAETYQFYGNTSNGDTCDSGNLGGSSLVSIGSRSLSPPPSRGKGFSMARKASTDLDMQLMRSKEMPGPADYYSVDKTKPRGGWVDKTNISHMNALLEQAKQTPGPGHYHTPSVIDKTQKQYSSPSTTLDDSFRLNTPTERIKHKGCCGFDDKDLVAMSPIRIKRSGGGGLPGGKFNMSNPKSDIDMKISVAAATPGAGEYNPNSPSKYDSIYKDRIPSSPSKLQPYSHPFDNEPTSASSRVSYGKEPKSASSSQRGASNAFPSVNNRSGNTTPKSPKSASSFR